jgi:HPt (histidine-containing phosphotransfer) domain-containing protein
VMDGYTAAGLMRERHVGLPVIAMTADAMLGAEQRCLDAGYSEYMTKPVDIDRLVDRLAELLGGEPLMEAETLTGQQADLDPVMNDHKIESAKIVSTLSMGNAKYRGIVERFVQRLGNQLTGIDSAWDQRDYATLKKLGHWLKGSAGTVGLPQFGGPARELEKFALAQADTNIQAVIQQLHSIYSRVAIEVDADSQAVVEKNKPVKEYLIPEKLESRFSKTKPKLRPVIGKFINQLSARCDVVEIAVANQDFREIENFGYWLKASGGSVGFSAFTEPARDLEVYAKEKQLDYIHHTVGVIRQLNNRIVNAGIEDVS